MTKRRFLILPGASITHGFDFTGQTLEQFGDNWLEDPRVPGNIVLRQPAHDANGKRCAEGGNVSIRREYTQEIT